MRAGRSAMAGDRHGLQEGHRGDHRRERRDADRRRSSSSSSPRRASRASPSRSASARSSRCSPRCWPRRRSSARWAARGCSRSPATLGAGEQRTAAGTSTSWAASKWFFAMSGVILLIGALAHRRQGPQLRHRLRVAARASRRRSSRPASVEQVRDALAPLGLGDAKIQKVNEPGARRATSSRSRRDSSSRARSQQVADGARRGVRRRPTASRARVDRADVRRRPSRSSAIDRDHRLAARDHRPTSRCGSSGSSRCRC